MVALLLGGGTISGGALEKPSEENPPVLLRGSQILTPWSAAGRDLAPEAEIEVKIDDRGRVQSVEVLKMSPAGGLEEDYHRALVDQVSSWRYAPATVAGEPVEVTLQWTVKFVPKEGKAADSRALPSSAEALLIDQELQDRGTRVLALPPEERRRILAEHRREAESFLDIPWIKRAESKRFSVITDSPVKGAAELYARNLEAVFSTLDALLVQQIQLQPEPDRLVLALFAERADLVQLMGTMGVPRSAAGFYRAPGLLAFDLQAKSIERLLQVMIHEATHAYLDSHVVARGRRLPWWLSEGFADYIGNSRIKKGQLQPGETLASSYVLGHWRAVRANTLAGDRLDQLKKVMKQGEGLSVDALTAAVAPGTSRNNVYDHYLTAWLFVHFLRHGEPGWAEEEFPRLLLYAAEGYPSQAALETSYGRKISELEAPFRQYVTRF